MAQTRETSLRENGQRVVTAAVAVLAAIGLALTVLTVRSDSREVRHTGGVGVPLDTEFGTFAVTRVSDTFVPDTQGPPDRHATASSGTNGKQLQVWVRLVNTELLDGLSYSVNSFRLVAENRAASRRPSGSSLAKGVLAHGASIDGRLWFDLRPRDTGRRWLSFRQKDGSRIRVDLGELAPFTPQPAQPPEKDHEPSEKQADDPGRQSSTAPGENGHDQEDGDGHDHDD